jgi:WD40 repeat protein
MQSKVRYVVGLAAVTAAALSACQPNINSDNQATPTTLTETVSGVTPTMEPLTATPTEEQDDVSTYFAGRVIGSVLSSEGNRLAIVSEAGLVMYDLVNRKFEWGVALNEPTAVDWSSEGQIIAVGQNNGAVLLIDGNSGTIVNSIELATDTVRLLTFNPDGTKLAIAIGQLRGSSHDLIIWDVISAQQESIFSEFAFGPVEWSPNGTVVALTLYREVAVFDPVSGQSILVGNGESQVFFTNWLDDHGSMLIVRTDGAGVWDVATQQLAASYETRRIIGDVQLYQPDSVIIAAAEDPVTLWNFVLDEVSMPFGERHASEADLSKTTGLLALRDDIANTITIIDSANDTVISEFPISIEKVTGMVWSPQADWLIVQSVDRIFLYNAAGGWSTVELVAGSNN